MFLNKVKERNPKLIEYAFKAHESGLILPDTYILDLDAIINNASLMKKEADKFGIDLYFMLKQIGRNPVVARELMKLGYQGCVAVDYREALCMINDGIHLANVGHLVQIPKAALGKIIRSGPDYVTVYSPEIIGRINEVAREAGTSQKLLLKLCDEDSLSYPGQAGGFAVSQVREMIGQISGYENVSLGGFTVFPALLYDEKEKKIVPTINMKSIERAREIAEECGLYDLNYNIPSATCCASMQLIHELGGRSGEPGHGLTGTTPLHAVSDQPEIPAYVYVSEISHYHGENACFYGGGYYRRGHLKHALIGKDPYSASLYEVEPFDCNCIDYYLEIKGKPAIYDTAVMAFRTQMFTTRSQVAVVKGIQDGSPELIGIFNNAGEKAGPTWRE